jgi:hypothetical protein
MLSSKLAAGALGAGAAALYYANSARPTLSGRRNNGVLAHAGAAAPGAVGPFGNPAHGWDYYTKCMMGGILSCGLTHTAIVPLDVVKCRMQVRTVASAGNTLDFFGINVGAL